MEESTSREKILKKVRNALIDKSENPFSGLDFENPVLPELEEGNEMSFAAEFTRIGGNFLFCANEQEVMEQLKALFNEKGWKYVFCLEPNIQKFLEVAQIPFFLKEEDIENTQVGCTFCEHLIARTGSIMLSSRQVSGRRLSVFPEVHVVFAFTSQIVPELQDALLNVQKKYGEATPSMITTISGPSRTADIEKTLVMGAHGPKELYLFLLDDQSS